MTKWLYEATVVRVKDGDTGAFDINLGSFNQIRERAGASDAALFDLGFSTFVDRSFLPLILQGLTIWRKDESIRFLGLNAPEKTTEDGRRVAAYVQGLLPIGTVVVLETVRVKSKTKQEKYGRFLGRIFLPDDRCLNDLLLEQGLARPFLI
jgi:endonuclease YncB( thermonuclease family)